MILLLVLGVIVVLNGLIVKRLMTAFRRLRIAPNELPGDDELPSVSICISARNETHAMTQCLERVVASEYPKLEIIVLDDGSRDDTSLLIKSFAHAGVRFIEGSPLPDGWLGKNYAQSILAREASGKYVFFMDVDTLIDRHTIARAVAYLLTNKADMVSIIPIRDDHWQLSTLFATMRHFWTLIRFSPRRPRAAANAWLIDREVLMDNFATDTSLAQSVQVETTIARKLASDNRYRLALSNTWLGLRYEKTWPSQVETSIRLLYPQCGKSAVQATGLIVLLALTVVPYAVVFWHPAYLAIIILQYLVAYYYLAHVWARYRIIGALLLPVTVIQEIVLIIVSTYRYHFGIITWKGRPVSRSVN